MSDCIPPPAKAPTDSWRARAAGNWKWWVGLVATLAVPALGFGITAIVQATEMRADIRANAKETGRNEKAADSLKDDIKAARSDIGAMKLDLAVIKESLEQIEASLREPQPRRRRR